MRFFLGWRAKSPKIGDMNSRILFLLSLLFSTVPFIPRADADTAAEEVVLATYKLINEKSTATGFVIDGSDGKRYVVTSAHVFEKMVGEFATIAFRKKNKDGTFSRHDEGVLIRDGKEPRWVKHPEQDVAVLELNVLLPAEVELYRLQESVLANEEAATASGFGAGSDVWISSFPTGFEVNDAGFPVTRRGCVASYPVRPVAKHPTMIIDSTTFEGDSGGPVFIRRKGGSDDPLVVGLIVAQYWHTEKLETFSGKQTINHSLGLATAVQSQAIIETLALHRKKYSKE